LKKMTYVANAKNDVYKLLAKKRTMILESPNIFNVTIVARSLAIKGWIYKHHR